MRVLQVETYWDMDDFNEFLTEILEECIKEIRLTANPAGGIDSEKYPLAYTAIYFKDIEL